LRGTGLGQRRHGPGKESTVDLHIELDGTLVAASADDDGLRVHVDDRRYESPWDEVVAGYVRDDARRAGAGAPTRGLLLLARGRGAERHEELVVPLLHDREDVTAFVAEVRRRAGAWTGDGWSAHHQDRARPAEDGARPGVAAELPTTSAPPWGLAVIALVIAGIVGWQLLEAGHVASPFTATVVTVVLTVTFLALVRLRTRR
jgi:hypothetical protein